MDEPDLVVLKDFILENAIEQNVEFTLIDWNNVPQEQRTSYYDGEIKLADLNTLPKIISHKFYWLKKESIFCLFVLPQNKIYFSSQKIIKNQFRVRDATNFGLIFNDPENFTYFYPPGELLKDALQLQVFDFSFENLSLNETFEQINKKILLINDFIKLRNLIDDFFEKKNWQKCNIYSLTDISYTPIYDVDEVCRIYTFQDKFYAKNSQRGEILFELEFDQIKELKYIQELLNFFTVEE